MTYDFFYKTILLWIIAIYDIPTYDISSKDAMSHPCVTDGLNMSNPIGPTAFPIPWLAFYVRSASDMQLYDTSMLENDNARWQGIAQHDIRADILVVKNENG